MRLGDPIDKDLGCLVLNLPYDTVIAKPVAFSADSGQHLYLEFIHNLQMNSLDGLLLQVEHLYALQQRTIGSVLFMDVSAT